MFIRVKQNLLLFWKTCINTQYSHNHFLKCSIQSVSQQHRRWQFVKCCKCKDIPHFSNSPILSLMYAVSWLYIALKNHYRNWVRHHDKFEELYFRTVLQSSKLDYFRFSLKIFFFSGGCPHDRPLVCRESSSVQRIL